SFQLARETRPLKRNGSAEGLSPSAKKTKKPGGKPGFLVRRQRFSRSMAGDDAFDQLLHRWDEAVRVERVGFEAVGVVACEHEVLFNVSAVADGLQRLLDAEGARVGQVSGGVLFVIGP